VSSDELAHHFLESSYLLIDSLGNDRVTDSGAVGDHLHAGYELEVLVITASRVDLLRRTPYQDEAADIPSGWRENHYVEAFDLPVLLTTPVVLQSFVPDVPSGTSAGSPQPLNGATP
jgi:hypothetical protein